LSFIYTYDGNNCNSTGNIRRAIFRSLERDDYMALMITMHPGGNYRIKMANMLEEIQYINQAT